jgi:hypothetical protein
LIGLGLESPIRSTAAEFLQVWLSDFSIDSDGADLSNLGSKSYARSAELLLD